MMNTKKEARRILKEKISSLSEETKKSFSNKAADFFLSTVTYKNADIILSFKSMNDEPSSEKISEQALKDGKILFLPVIEPDKPEMDFYKTDKSSSFAVNCFGTLEPLKNKSSIFLAENYKNKKIVILIPGRGFNRYGERLGRGKGYYDRYIYELQKKAGLLNISIFKAGICFSVQMQTPFPSEAHDIKMDAVITEEEIIFSNSSIKL